MNYRNFPKITKINKYIFLYMEIRFEYFKKYVKILNIKNYL